MQNKMTHSNLSIWFFLKTVMTVNKKPSKGDDEMCCTRTHMHTHTHTHARTHTHTHTLRLAYRHKHTHTSAVSFLNESIKLLFERRVFDHMILVHAWTLTPSLWFHHNIIWHERLWNGIVKCVILRSAHSTEWTCVLLYKTYTMVP